MPRRRTFPKGTTPPRVIPSAKKAAEARRANWKAICARVRQARYERDLLLMTERAAKSAATRRLNAIKLGSKKKPIGKGRPADVPTDDDVEDAVDD